MVDFVQTAAATVTGGTTAAGMITPNRTCMSDNCTQNATAHTLLNNITETGGYPGGFMNGIKGVVMKGVQGDQQNMRTSLLVDYHYSNFGMHIVTLPCHAHR